MKQLSDLDRIFLDTLTYAVPLFSMSQAADQWFPTLNDSKAATKRRVQNLVKHGYVTILKPLCHPMLELQTPFVVWGPGKPRPNFSSVSYSLQSRWTAPIVPTTIIVPTPRTLALLGASSVKKVLPTQVTHDLHVSAIYLKYRARDPEVAALWRGERAYSQNLGEKRPDAFIVDTLDRPQTAIEFGGSYPAIRVRRFHEHCEVKGLCYELW